jgi:hypothetical protein
VARKFVVDKVEFSVDGPSLSYAPTKGTRTYQVVAAVGIALVSGTVSAVLAVQKPLSHLFDEGDAWNTAAVIGGAVISLGLLMSIPVYWHRSGVVFVLDAKRRSLDAGSRRVRDLTTIRSVLMNCICDGEGGKTWSVGFRDQGQGHSLPLLVFPLKEEAERVAAEISVLFGVVVES